MKKEKQRPTYPGTKLKYNTFLNKNDLEEWANSKHGTDYIVAICYEPHTMFWVLWYIID